MPSGGPAVPDVSVVTPSYGYAHYLRDAVDSVVEQRGVTVEHVIQDGASTDGTVELLRELDDLVDWTSEPDEGQSDALNRGISRARRAGRTRRRSATRSNARGRVKCRG